MKLYDEDGNGGLWCSKDKGKSWALMGHITKVSIELSEEDSARLYSQLEGLEIVSNPERE